MTEKLREIAEKIADAQNLVVLTGAGVSTASGIPDFRSSEGLWSKDFKREDYMSNHYFFYDPVDFWLKYKQIFQVKLLKQYEPNVVHQFIKELETEERQVTVITQNVDGLHEKAGSSKVIEYHGTLDKANCPSCRQSYSMDYVLDYDPPKCQTCKAILKPNVVLFGDLITAHDESEALLDQADCLLVLGTSLQVTPFSFLPDYSRQRKTPSVLMNKESTIKDYVFDEVLLGDLTEWIPKLQTEVNKISSS
ncbi:NAD-dependent protein deacylase [Halobacillus sp. A5]|uniref:NAD-dependent protein deacylase n=1 Tax=Halobacillus sp. A5 TaxID=2880263 RepID=UPI0020A63E0F|nr:NAD-dependent protein deacylase [Halobacillus sp. A5]MCP3026333.1 NAD-dependent protein deacylase [Halobacillus sp. A5]